MVLDTINTILYSDLGSIYNISGDKINSLRKLLTSICVSNPLELSIESLAQKVGTSKVTLYKYIEFLTLSCDAKKLSLRVPICGSKQSDDNKVVLAKYNLSGFCIDLNRLPS